MLKLFPFIAIAICLTKGQWLPRMVTEFNLEHAAYIEIFEDTNYSNDTEDYAERFNMFVTTFNPRATYSPDAVYTIPAPGKLLSSGANSSNWEATLKIMGGKKTAYWPNYSVRLPYELGGFDGILQTSGYGGYGYGGEAGQLEVYNNEEGNEAGPWNIATKPTGHNDSDRSYHWAIFKDVNDDGLLDVMTARFHLGLNGHANSQLVWLQNPGNLTPNNANNEWSSPWECHVIYEGGPDVYFENRVFTKLDGSKYDVIMGAEHWSQQLSLYYVEDQPAAWDLGTTNGSEIKKLVLDKYNGTPYEANFMDLNNDGVEEIVVSYFEVGVPKV